MNPRPATARPPLVLAIGMFDGIHRGHQAVFQRAVETARQLQGRAGCLTFHPHVAQLLNPARAPLLLATAAQNHAQIIACGVAEIHTIPFTRELVAMSPADFLHLLKNKFPMLAGIVVGPNFTFGKDRAGNADTLPALAAAISCGAQIVAPVEWGGAVISSTRIRRAVQEGDLAAARAMLGRSFALAGPVIRGRAVGRQMGFPTANIQPELPIRPAPGVYAARLQLADGLHPGAAFVPDPQDPAQHHFGNIVEIHLPGLSRNLYDLQTEISFTRRLRGYLPFSNAELAAAQIARDTAAALAADQDSP